jgi:hypothetical protein
VILMLLFFHGTALTMHIHYNPGTKKKAAVPPRPTTSTPQIAELRRIVIASGFFAACAPAANALNASMTFATAKSRGTAVNS